MFRVENFTKNGENGRIVTFSFTAQNNANGVNFNPLSVFTKEAVANAKTDKNHDEKLENFAQELTTYELVDSYIKGNEVFNTVKATTTDKAFIELIESENFSGVSPSLIAHKAPVPNRNVTPRFYEDGALELFTFSLLDNQKPAFKGADKMDVVERFSAIDEMTLTATLKEKETEEKTDEKTESETFALIDTLQSELAYVKDTLHHMKKKYEDFATAIEAINAKNEDVEPFSIDNNEEEDTTTKEEQQFVENMSKLSSEKMLNSESVNKTTKQQTTYSKLQTINNII